jgi:hypothetical protein
VGGGANLRRAGATGAGGSVVAPTADAARAQTPATTTATQGQASVNKSETERAAASSQPSGAAKKTESGARQAQAAAQRDARKSAQDSAARGGYVVHVLMEVKDGRVAEARVLNPRPGAGAYEALALRLARQRRYPDKFTGGDTWKIRVKP